MGCSSCGAAAAANKQNIMQRSMAPTVPVGPCSYTKPMLEIWLQKLTCIKEGDKFDSISSNPGEINGFLGVVISALKNESKICNFLNHLDNISATIIKIANQGEC